VIDTTALGSGLTFTEFTIAPEIAEGFGRWHSDEHAAERLAIDGVRSVRRFVSSSEPLRCACLYRAATSDTFRRPDYLALITSPTPTTKHMLAGISGTRLVGNIARETGMGYGPLACRVRIVIDPADDERVPEWFDATATALLASEGVVRMMLISPRRELDNVSDPNWIAWIEGYDADALGTIAAGGHRVPASLGDITSHLFRLEHMMP
jgi:hypothetical protein